MSQLLRSAELGQAHEVYLEDIKGIKNPPTFQEWLEAPEDPYGEVTRENVIVLNL